MAFNNTIIHTNAFKAPGYAFLSQPPPPKRRAAPTQPLPSIPVETPLQERSAKIAAWAALIQPGSPVPPTPQCAISPRRSSASNRRRPSFNSLRPSACGGTQHGRAVSNPYVVTPTTASHKTFDFTAVGYNNIFVNVPVTPATPSPLLREKAMRDQAFFQAKLEEKERAKEQSKGRKDKVMNKIKSLANLRSRSKPVSKTDASEVPTLPPMPSSKPKGKINKKAISKPSHKKSIYGPLVRAPPTLHNELALMQFADGGRLNDHARRVMVGPDGVGDIYRDGKGGVWWDREEEMEYQALLVENEDADADNESEEEDVTANWVKFPRNSSVQTQGRSSEDTLVAPEPTKVKAERPPSSSTLSSRDSDLDPAYLMQPESSPAYHNDRVLDFDLRAGANASGSLKANNASSKRNAMLLCLPARPSRTAKHLRKPELMYESQAFAVVPKSPRSPVSPRFNNFPASIANKPRGKARRRPAPLKISPSMTKMRRVVAVSSPDSALPPLPSVPVFDVMKQQQLIREGKQEFLHDSFEPEVSRFDTDSEDDFVQDEVKVHVSALKKRRGSMLDLKSILKRN